MDLGATMSPHRSQPDHRCGSARMQRRSGTILPGFASTSTNNYKRVFVSLCVCYVCFFPSFNFLLYLSLIISRFNLPLRSLLGEWKSDQPQMWHCAHAEPFWCALARVRVNQFDKQINKQTKVSCCYVLCWFLVCHCFPHHLLLFVSMVLSHCIEV